MFRYTDKRNGAVMEFDVPQPAFAHDWWQVEEINGEPSPEPQTVEPPAGADGTGTGGDGKPSAPDPLPEGYKTLKRPQLEALATGLGVENAAQIPNAPDLVKAIESRHADLVAAAA